MQFSRLGRTDLPVSVAGLGCGGHSRLGQAYGNSIRSSVRVVRAALDAGVNFIDTAAAYRTEPIVGRALRGRRDQVFVSTKTLIHKRDQTTNEERPLRAPELVKRFEDSLQRLQTDYVDVYNLHGVLAQELDYVRSELIAPLERLKQQGKVRFLGITERFVADTGHDMLAQALEMGMWDVVMVGFNLLNPSARERVLARTQVLDIGVQDMFAVRRALANTPALNETIRMGVEAGQIDPADIDATDPLGGVLAESGARSLVELAYRFCRHEPGIHVVLTGTGNIAHLEQNIDAINAGPLPDHTRQALEALFGRVDCLSGN